MARVKTFNTAALGIALSACAPIALFEVFMHTEWYSMLATVAISFLSIFIFARFFFKQFVIYKIKPIYRLATSKTISTREMTNIFSRKGDILVEIQEELAGWSEKRQMEIAEFQDSERFRKEYIGNVAHEIKTPLFTIQGYILTLLDGALEDPEINHLYLERAAQNLERLTNIMADLDEISRMDSGEGKLNLTVFDMKELVRDVFEQLELEAAKHDIRLKIGPTATPRALVYADRSRIEQVLTNLVSNSIKYGKPGGTTVVNFINMYDEAVIEVEDNGIGISEENQKRLFERFYRVDKSRSREQGGTGLGLSIVRHIVEAHQGQLSVRSEPGKGSVFSFSVQRPPQKGKKQKEREEKTA